MCLHHGVGYHAPVSVTEIAQATVTRSATRSSAELRAQLSQLVGAVTVVYLMTSAFESFATVPQLVLDPTRQLAVSGLLLALVVGLAPRKTWQGSRIGIPVLAFVAHQVGLYWLTTAPQLWRSTALPDILLLLNAVCVAATLNIKGITRAMLLSIYLMTAVCWAWILFRSGEAKGATTIVNSNLDAVGWRGTFLHKNLMSMYMVVGVALIMLFESRRVRFVALLGPVGLVVIAQSSTGVVALLSLAVLFGLRAVRARLLRGVGSSMLAVLIVAVVGFSTRLDDFLDLLYRSLGKDSTLSSRTIIWSASWRAIKQRPWTGWGPGATWQLVDREPSLSMLREIQFPVYHAHNGFFELMLSSGVLGVVLYLVIVIWAVVLSFRLIVRDEDLGWLLLMTVATILLCAVSEPVIRKGWLAIIVLLSSMGLVRLRQLGVTDRLRRPSFGDSSTVNPTHATRGVA
jgi:O-antigen ligase